MATADASAFPPPGLAQPPVPAAMSGLAADAASYFANEGGQMALQKCLARQLGQILPSYVCEWVPTSLRLSAEQDVYLCLPVHLSEPAYFKNNEEKEECKDDGYCSDAAAKLRLRELDRYLAAVSPLAESTRRLLFGAPSSQRKGCSGQIDPKSVSKDCQPDDQDHESYFFPLDERPHSSPHRLVTSTNCGRVINVLQDEIAHCTPSQAEVLVSDDATTCHIVALWSRSANGTLATMTHIDGTGYDTSIRDAVHEHAKFHSVNSSSNYEAEECKSPSGGAIDLSIHIMGGFNDRDASSIQITDSILRTLVALSNEYTANPSSMTAPMRMVLETCAVVSANDNGTGCPLGRGLALEVLTGKIYLAEVEDVCSNSTVTDHGYVISANPHSECGSIISAQGPYLTLRSVRLWASAFHPHFVKQEHHLSVIHRPNEDHLQVEPFFFRPHVAAKGLLDCCDEELIQITSTSPDVEKNNFVRKVRESLEFMNQTSSASIFVSNQPVRFQRVGMNGWRRSIRL